ncbi:MAG: methyltransferase domain-containing protein [Chlamydiota bacterium]|nr:methyltransferase domain-containing protein [Chlamydiota bacterium]
MIFISQHYDESVRNLERLKKKPLLSKIYSSFYQLIAQSLYRNTNGHIVELGSGIGNIKDVIPECLCTDIFLHAGVDQIENVYQLSFQDESVSNLVLFDVFHHLRYPGTALHEWQRVLTRSGRIIMVEPCLSLLGLLVYGVFHSESLGLNMPIEWFTPLDWRPDEIDYYASQANAYRIFVQKKYWDSLMGWRVISVKKMSAISYVASGGYSKPQFYPSMMLPVMKLIDRVCDLFPSVFATRMIIVLEKSCESKVCN